MTLLDAGPWIAIVDRSDAEHARCKSLVHGIVGPLVTTWPVVAEVMHMLGRRIGWNAQAQAWGMILTGAVRVECPGVEATARIHSLMAKYRNVPMDLGDAAMVALAETHNTRHIFTIDSDFGIYRFKDRMTFEIVGS